MAFAALKLESFSSAPAEIAQVSEAYFTQADLDRARAEGLAEGERRSEEGDIASLRSELDRMGEMIEADEARRKDLHAEAVATLLPVLSEVVEAMSPSIVSQRLEQALKDELDRMANEAAPVCVQISCGEKLKELVEGCAAESKLSEYKLECTEGDSIAISHSESCLKLSQDRITQQIRKLIDEMIEDSATWTT